MSPSYLTACSVALGCALAACGSVKASDAPDAAPPAADAWLSTCTASALVTKIEEADSGFGGGGCVQGSWLLEAFNGTTTPATRSGEVVLVNPAPITIGSNTLDPSSTFAIHVLGSGQENIGTMFAYAQLTATLNAPSATLTGSVDASAFSGIQFYAMGKTGAAGARFTVGNLYTDPIGKMCTVEGGMATSCFDNPGIQIALTATWSRFQIPFANLMQLGFGNPSPVGAAFPKSAITHLKWDIGIPATGPTEAWEIWVDDLTFY